MTLICAAYFKIKVPQEKKCGQSLWETGTRKCLKTFVHRLEALWLPAHKLPFYHDVLLAWSSSESFTYDGWQWQVCSCCPPPRKLQVTVTRAKRRQTEDQLDSPPLISRAICSFFGPGGRFHDNAVLINGGEFYLSLQSVHVLEQILRCLFRPLMWSSNPRINLFMTEGSSIKKKLLLHFNSGSLQWFS